MNLPVSILGWASVLGLVWAAVAFAGASWFALRLFNHLKCDCAPRPFCTLAAVTRQALKRPPAGVPIHAVDKMRLGALVVAFATGAMAALNLYDLSQMPWGSIKPTVDMGFIVARITLGSGLMVLQAGILHFIAPRGVE